jgi:hypothetical protein
LASRTRWTPIGSGAFLFEMPSRSARPATWAKRSNSVSGRSLQNLSGAKCRTSQHFGICFFEVGVERQLMLR